MKDEVIRTDNSNLLFKFANAGQPKDLTDACTEFTGNPPLEFSTLFKIVTCQENKVPEPLDLDRSTFIWHLYSVHGCQDSNFPEPT